MAKKIILIGVARTGSGSMKNALQSLGGRFIYPRNGPRNKPASIVKEEVGEEEWNNSFKFAFTRHPLSRFISGYYNMVVNRNIKPPTIEEVLELSDKEQINPYLFKPMVEIIDEPLDFIGRYENLEEDWKKIWGNMKLRHDNEGPKIPKPITKEHIDFVKEYYKEDFERFNYKINNIKT